MRELGDRLREALGSGVVVLVTQAGDRVTWVTMVTKDLTARLHAGTPGPGPGQDDRRGGGRSARHGRGRGQGSVPDSRGLGRSSPTDPGAARARARKELRDEPTGTRQRRFRFLLNRADEQSVINERFAAPAGVSVADRAGRVRLHPADPGGERPALRAALSRRAGTGVLLAGGVPGLLLSRPGAGDPAGGAADPGPGGWADRRHQALPGLEGAVRRIARPREHLPLGASMFT